MENFNQVEISKYRLTMKPVGPEEAIEIFEGSYHAKTRNSRVRGWARNAYTAGFLLEVFYTFNQEFSAHHNPQSVRIGALGIMATAILANRENNRRIDERNLATLVQSEAFNLANRVGLPVPEWTLTNSALSRDQSDEA